MPLALSALCSALVPSRTALLLGAGASVPSGAPTGSQLAHRVWREVAKTEPQTDDLVDAAGILERRYGRRAVIDSVVGALKDLTPSGGLLGLPRFGWHELYSTNFDRLIEASYKATGIPLTAIRSNYDFSHREAREGTSLYKIHGCISQDRSLGDKPSMILTEQDYEDFEKYRQSVFSLLQASLLTHDVLIVGQSLRDRHLNDLVKKVLSYKHQGAPGEIYVLVYDKDDLRAPLLEDRGARVVFGGIDEFVHAMSTAAPPQLVAAAAVDEVLPINLVSIVDNVAHARTREPNVVRMFNGAPATYADIRAGATFERAAMASLLDQLEQKAVSSVALTGAAGVGKTTFARQILHHASQNGWLAFEHKTDFPFQSQPWINVEATLRQQGLRAVLLLDECTRYLRQVNLLIDHLATLSESALRVVLTANAAQWDQRIKSASIFTKGRVIELTRLVDSELHSLVNLVHYNRPVADLVQSDFRVLARGVQFSRLKERCSADMFVCLKNIFANESLDRILLVEYDELSEASQEHYRYIAALEAVGMRVHRQLVMRLLGLRADQVVPVLAGLKGIVDEFVINERDGIYGWSTRHIVIARKITEYKFSSFVDLQKLFQKIIANINPGIHTELQSVRDLCDTDHGIGRLGDPAVRRKLYRELIDIAPAERIPWHRLIRELLDEGALEEVEYLIRDAIEAVGRDAPIDRFRVRLLVARAEVTKGISQEDRLALLRKAYELAQNNIGRHKTDKYSYRVLCQVAVKLVELGETIHVLNEAIAQMRQGAQEILDPEMNRDLRQFEETCARL